METNKYYHSDGTLVEEDKKEQLTQDAMKKILEYLLVQEE